MRADASGTADRLDSWKEIAAYLSRGVRTVRRWEHDEGLPVHRHVHRVQGTVYAFRSEIDAWRRTGARHSTPGAAAWPAQSPKSIAVLPFSNLSADAENAYFADGLTEEIIADLSKVQALRVISRTSCLALKGTTKDMRTIGRELGARYVLEGSVRREGDRLRITAQLIDASADGHLWADKYDGTVGDVFAFQERLARVIVGALDVTLSADEDRRLASRPIANVHAYECYLRARVGGWRWRKDAIDHSIQLLQNGLAIVGDNAVLFAALGLAHIHYKEAGIDATDRPILQAEACAQKVFALDPRSASGLQLRGWIHYARGRIQDAVYDLKAALAIDGNNADTLGLLANCYVISGQVAAGRPIIERLLAVDPLTPVNRCMPGFADIMEGRFERALAPYRSMFEMDPGNPMAGLFYAWVLILNEKLDAFRGLLETFPRELRNTVPVRLAFFLGHAIERDTERMRALVTPQVEAAAADSDVFARMLAQGYALAGITDRAIYWLETAVRRGFINYPFLAQHDPFTASLRSDGRFMLLMEDTRARWKRFEV